MTRDLNAPRATGWPWDLDLPTLTLSRLRKLGAKAMGDAKRGLARMYPEGDPCLTDDGYAAYLAICGVLDQARLSEAQLVSCLAHVLEIAAASASLVAEPGDDIAVDARSFAAVIKAVAYEASTSHRAAVAARRAATAKPPVH